MKYILIILLALFLSSCEDETKIIYTSSPKSLDTLAGDFKIEYEIYPNYTFWEHTFYLKLKKSQDITNIFRFFFNEEELIPLEAIDTLGYLTYYFQTPLLSNSDKIEIRNYISDTEYLISETSKYEVVNSEILIEEINIDGCSGKATIKGKGLKYAKYISVLFIDAVDKPFESADYYSNSESQKSSKVVITNNSDSSAYFEYRNGSSIGLRIEAPDSLKNILLDKNNFQNIYNYYKYIYKSNSHFYVQSPKIVDYSQVGNKLTLKLQYCLNINDLNLKFGNKQINKDDITLVPSVISWDKSKLVSTNAEISFQIPEQVDNHLLEISLPCKLDTNFVIPYTHYKSVFISAFIEKTIWDVSVNYGGMNFNLNDLTITKTELFTDSKFKDSYGIFNEKSEGRGHSSLTMTLTLFQVGQNYVDFMFTEVSYGSHNSNIQHSSKNETKISYKGSCKYTETNDYIKIILNREELEKSTVNKSIYSKTSGTSVNSGFEGYIQSIEYTDNAFLEIIINK